MAFLLDTNIVSASRRPDRQTAAFQRFLRAFEAEAAYLSSVTVMELEFGIQHEREHNPDFAADLSRWLTTIVIPAFADRILPFAEQEATIAGRLPTANKRPTADAMIAATALAHNLILVTRNVSDFQTLGVTCRNPWDETSEISSG